MEDWDQETLEKVVESKKMEYNPNKPTEIVCLCTTCESTLANCLRSFLFVLEFSHLKVLLSFTLNVYPSCVLFFYHCSSNSLFKCKCA